MDTTHPIWQKFDVDHNLIKEYQYWYLLVKRKQVRLGSCVVLLKREAFPMRELNAEEVAEYLEIIKKLENATEKAFGAEYSQHLSVMFKDRQIHFHVVPRYSGSVDFGGITWEESANPHPLTEEGDFSDQELLDQIKEAIKQNLTSK